MLRKWILLLLPIWFTFAILANQSNFYSQSNNFENTYSNSFDYLPNQTASDIFHQAAKKFSHETFLLTSSNINPIKIFSWSYEQSLKLIFYQFTFAKTKLNNFYLLV